MSFGNLQMVDVCTFEIENFAGKISIDFFNVKDVMPFFNSDYKSFGYRGMNKGFHSETGVVHIFEQSSIPQDFFRYRLLIDSSFYKISKLSSFSEYLTLHQR
jgi:hypothetical protein